MWIVCLQTIHMKWQALFFTETWKTYLRMSSTIMHGALMIKYAYIVYYE